MATTKKELETKLSKKNPSTSTKPIRNIPTTGAEAFYEDTADNTAKDVRAEEEENKEVEQKSTPKTTTKKQTSTTASTSSKKKTTAKKLSPAPVAEEKEAGELIKTTVYIEEENFLALEDIQLKLKRQEKRRVTKNELFNKAIELLIEHYE